MTMKDKLIHAVTQYDMKMETRKGHNIYALPQYFAAVDDAMEYVDQKGWPVEKALRYCFNDRLLDICLKAVSMILLFSPALLAILVIVSLSIQPIFNVRGEK